VVQGAPAAQASPSGAPGAVSIEALAKS